ncbi:MAG: lysophospholipid acyltransferase family protein [Bacteroidota bacterium]|nr:lysophospholipid acyltransferase family protein [Bacteroidota bacterium]
MRNFLEYVILLPFRAMIFILPLRVVQFLGKLLGTFVFYIVPIRKTLTLSNLRHAFPEKSEFEIQSIARASYQNLFATFLEIFWLPRLTQKKIKQCVSASNVSVIDELMTEQKGVLILSGHFGNWELVALAYAVLCAHPLLLIVQKQRNRYVDALMNKMRTMFGNDVIVMEQSPREVLKRLHENKGVALLADQSGPEGGLFVNYFGRPASTHQGPAVFALRTGAPMMMGFMVRQPHGKFFIEVEKISYTGIGETEEDKIRAITERHVQMLEKYVRKYPDQWLWMHKRWKHTDTYLQRTAAESK